MFFIFSVGFLLIEQDSNCLSVIVFNTISDFLSDYSEPGIIKYFENIEKNPKMKRNIPSIPPNSVLEVPVPRRKNPITKFSIFHAQSDQMLPWSQKCRKLMYLDTQEQGK